MKYILALTVGLPEQGSAIAILERRPQKGKRNEDWSDDDLVVTHDWIDHHALTYLERVPSGESIPLTAARVARMLASADLKGDADLVLDGTTYGRNVAEKFYQLEPCPPTYRIALGGEVETQNPALGGWTLPERDIRGALTLHAQEGRLTVAAELPLGAPLLRALDNPDATPDRAIYLATALAVWLGRRCQTHGPWPSSRFPRGAEVMRELEEIATNERRERRRREVAEPVWRRGYGGGGWGE